MRATRTVRRAFVAVIGVALAVGVAGPVLATPEEQRLERARERLADVRAELEQAREARDAEEKALEVAKERVEDVLAAVGEAELAVERQEAAVAAAEGKLADLEADVESHLARTGGRITALYRNAGTSTITSMLAATSPGEALARSSLLDAVNRSDRRAFEGVAAAHRAFDAQAERLEEEQEALERVLVQQQELLAEVEQLRDDQAVALAEAEQELDRLESHEAHLEAESRELAAIARRASERADRQARAARTASAPATESGSGSGGGGGGSWIWPAQGSVTSEFGMRWGRLHAGIDIAGAHGSAVVAARSGTVSHAGSMGGYGNIIMIDHGGGVSSAYAHLSSIETRVGAQVSQGQRIGGMGCTGSCTGTHLHFEVRINGNPQNPRGYLP